MFACRGCEVVIDCYQNTWSNSLRVNYNCSATFVSLAPLRNELPSGIRNLRTSFGMVKNAVASLGPLIVCLPLLSVVCTGYIEYSGISGWQNQQVYSVTGYGLDFGCRPCPQPGMVQRS
ncbi:hypothetical protein BDW75DRAFT_225857, partial [Aspergillus navahoensis]